MSDKATENSTTYNPVHTSADDLEAGNQENSGLADATLTALAAENEDILSVDLLSTSDANDTREVLSISEKKSSCRVVQRVFLFAASSWGSLQGSVSSFNAGHIIATGDTCVFGDLQCYFVPENVLDASKDILGSDSFFSNVGVGLVFLPIAIQKFKKELKEFKCSSSTAMFLALLFACVYVTFMYQLSRDTYAGATETVALLFIIPGMPTQAATRFVASLELVRKYREIVLLALALGPFRPAIQDDRFSLALVVANDFNRYAYTLSDESRSKITELMKAGDYHAAFEHFYSSRPSMTWVQRCFDVIFEGMLTLVILLSSLVVYNIFLHLTFKWGPVVAELSAALGSLPTMCYYFYSGWRLPNMVFRAHALACHVNTPKVHFLHALSHLVALLSFGGLWLSGRNQGLEGDYRWTGLSDERAASLFSFVAGATSWYCNLLALLALFIYYVQQSKELKKSIEDFEGEMASFVKRIKAVVTKDNNANANESVVSLLPEDDSLLCSLDVVRKEFYKTDKSHGCFSSSGRGSYTSVAAQQVCNAV